MAELPKLPRLPKSCPLCRIAMIGERSDPNRADFDIYRCLRCDSTIRMEPPHRRNED
jgi:hypothetical protein